MSKIKNFTVVILSALFVFGFFIWGIILPDKDISTTERRKLGTFPKVSTDTILEGTFMSDFESYTLDHFPLRDTFRGLKAFTSYNLLLQKDNNDLYNADGYIVKMEYPMDQNSITHATSRFELIYNNYLKDTDTKVYLSIVPDKNALVPKEDGYLSMDYNLFTETLREQMPYAEYIDIFPLLELSDYYATDTHWRQEKITDVAKHLAESMGATLTDSYTEKDTNIPFYGVYHGQAALPIEPDSLMYLESDTINNCTVLDLESNSTIPMYDWSKLESSDPSKIPDPYEMFLSGPNRSVLEITNPNATSDKELIIIRDSYANALAPLLTSGYKKITLIDIRRVPAAYLGNLITFTNQDVLFLQSTLVLNDSKEIK